MQQRQKEANRDITRPTRDWPTETQVRQREANRDTRMTCNRGRERPTETQGGRPKLRDTTRDQPKQREGSPAGRAGRRQKAKSETKTEWTETEYVWGAGRQTEGQRQKELVIVSN